MLLCSMLGFLGAVCLFAALRFQLQARTLRLELAALRTEQEQRMEASANRNQVKDEFLSTVSHELRTPLTSMRSALGLLAGGLGSPDPRAQNLLRIALTNSDRLLRLINDILDLERMESGRAPLQLRRCDLAQIARDACETMVPQSEAAGVHIEIEPALAFLSFPVEADSDRILQVLINLLSNAIKFSHTDGSIRIDARAADGSLLLTVSDEGRGVPGDQLDSIFDRFRQVEPADSRQKGGTGLGLSICRAILQQHGGCIWAEANPGGAGLILTIQLPFPADAAQPVLEEEPELALA